MVVTWIVAFFAVLSSAHACSQHFTSTGVQYRCTWIKDIWVSFKFPFLCHKMLCLLLSLFCCTLLSFSHSQFYIIAKWALSHFNPITHKWKKERNSLSLTEHSEIVKYSKKSKHGTQLLHHEHSVYQNVQTKQTPTICIWWPRCTRWPRQINKSEASHKHVICELTRIPNNLIPSSFTAAL